MKILASRLNSSIITSQKSQDIYYQKVTNLIKKMRELKLKPSMNSFHVLVVDRLPIVTVHFRVSISGAMLVDLLFVFISLFDNVLWDVGYMSAGLSADVR